MNPTPLAGRALVDATGATLRTSLVKLFHYAKARAKYLDPKSPHYETTKSHLADIEKLLLAAQEYSSAVDACLSSAPGPAIDVLSMSPAQLLAHREADPVYRLGYVRGYKRGYDLSESRYGSLAGLYSQHATLVPPPTYTTSPLVARVRVFLETPEMQRRAALPLDQRQALAAITAHNLPSQEHKLWDS